MRRLHIQSNLTITGMRVTIRACSSDGPYPWQMVIALFRPYGCIYCNWSRSNATCDLAAYAQIKLLRKLLFRADAQQYAACAAATVSTRQSSLPPLRTYTDALLQVRSQFLVVPSGVGYTSPLITYYTMRTCIHFLCLTCIFVGLCKVRHSK